MRAMHITNFATLAADPDRPKMAVYFSIHAREYTPAEIGTRFAEWLVDNYGTDPEATWLVDHNDFHLILLANPDARKEAEQQIYHRKNMDDAYGDVNQCGRRRVLAVRRRSEPQLPVPLGHHARPRLR